jgi:two-component system response regulator ResD
MTHAVLLVEDEERIRNFVAPFLQKAGFIVDECGSGEQGLELALSGKYSLVLLDVMLPGISGTDVLRELRKTSSVPVLMLTAKSGEGDIIAGFEGGADDYITKPFSPRELVVRVKAVIARCYPEKKDVAVSCGPLTLHPEARRALVDDTPLSLTPKEFDLLLTLCESPDKVFSREELLRGVWGYDFLGDARTVDTHIKQAREKLGARRDMLATVWGKGYKITPP